MALDREHQDRLVEWLSAPAGTMQEGANAFLWAMQSLDAPHVRMRPTVNWNGKRWCAAYDPKGPGSLPGFLPGVAGYGDTPAEACAEFDKVWLKGRTCTSPS